MPSKPRTPFREMSPVQRVSYVAGFLIGAAIGVAVVAIAGKALFDGAIRLWHAV